MKLQCSGCPWPKCGVCHNASWLCAKPFVNFFPIISATLENCKPCHFICCGHPLQTFPMHCEPLMYLAKNDYRHYHQYFHLVRALSTWKFMCTSKSFQKALPNALPSGCFFLATNFQKKHYFRTSCQLL